MIKKALFVCLLSGFTSYSYSSTCSPPVFEGIDSLQELVKPSVEFTVQEFTSVRLMRIASLNLPSPFLDVIYSDGLGFRTPSKDLSVNINYQGVDEISEFDVKGIAPYEFYEKMFESPSGEAQCMYLEVFDVNRQDYRVSASVGSGKVFAFGSKDLHRIYILNKNNQNKVAAIVLKTFNVRYVFEILKSLKFME